LDVLLTHTDVLPETNELLRALEIPYQTEVVPLGGHADLYALDLVDTRTGPTGGNRVGLPDVGSGVGQLLPILVQLAVHKTRFAIGGASLLLWEQPELHLHPLWQARLARLFIERPWISRGSSEPRFQVIAETHSEHFVLGLKNDIEQGRIQPDEAIVLVFSDDKTAGRTEVTPIRFDEKGRFTEIWPGGFFTERLELQDGRSP
jgi:predicted ATPase